MTRWRRARGPDVSRPGTLLELLLPGGRAGSALVLGSGCPERLAPAVGAGEGEGQVDLAVLAPSRSELERDDWLAGAAATCAARLAPDGVAYALVPRRWRSRARARLKAAGMAAVSAMLHLPDAQTSQQLIPLDRASVGYAFGSVVPVVPWKRTAMEALLMLGGRRALVSSLDGVALLARHREARPLVDWLPMPGVQAGAPRSVVVSVAWRGVGASVVLHPLAEGADPPIVAKLALGSEAEPAAEQSRLARLGPTAVRAGAVVPAPLRAAHLDGAPILIESRVDGRILAPLLGRRPAQLWRRLSQLCDWLDAWQRLSATTTPGTSDQLEREVLAPARALAPHLDRGEEYVAALEARCATAADAPAPLVASHNDLTMWNVLLDRQGRLGIVDWEVAEDATLPLKDFFYAVVDAVAATDRYADRPGAARASFDPEGEHAGRVAELQASMARSIRASPEIVELAFHACWLGHAANELGKVGSSDPAPFREIVQWLVQRELVQEN
jgi:Phosphotransferase enzyme family